MEDPLARQDDQDGDAVRPGGGGPGDAGEPAARPVRCRLHDRDLQAGDGPVAPPSGLAALLP